MASLRLPTQVRACLFDLDGVLTKTAVVHAAAWKEMFDAFLRARPEPFVPFDAGHDYDTYVDGKTRSDGVRSFLESRGIVLPEGAPDDPTDAETVRGLGNRKNALVLELIRRQGVEPYEDAEQFVRAVRAAGLSTAVVSSSANCREVVHAAGLDGLFDVRVDALVAAEQGLAGKPAPDTYLAAARMLGVGPASSAVFEDALAGVEAGRAGGFALVVGVDRVGQADALRAHGADVVVQALTQLLDDR
ncbi:MAG TPA: beta-phosphoglucomutase family hydrolase [Gaiellaceae bacterium]|nr:beta-phosphoglucomutase family hydrolase [Gaiellaceae bacterium]